MNTSDQSGLTTLNGWEIFNSFTFKTCQLFNFSNNAGYKEHFFVRIGQLFDQNHLWCVQIGGKMGSNSPWKPQLIHLKDNFLHFFTSSIRNKILSLSKSTSSTLSFHFHPSLSRQPPASFHVLHQQT